MICLLFCFVLSFDCLSSCFGCPYPFVFVQVQRQDKNRQRQAKDEDRYGHRPICLTMLLYLYLSIFFSLSLCWFFPIYLVSLTFPASFSVHLPSFHIKPCISPSFYFSPSCLATSLFCLQIPLLVMAVLVLSRLVSSRRVVSCLALPCLALPCLVLFLSCNILPCFYLVFLSRLFDRSPPPLLSSAVTLPHSCILIICYCFLFLTVACLLSFFSGINLHPPLNLSPA